MRFFASLLACLVVSAFCFVVLSPTVGFDDANITMAYAENIAAGYGYVYNIGGERVEGSTSPLWTAINTVGFLLPVPPEVFLAFLGFLIGVTTIWVSMRIADELFQASGSQTGPAVLIVIAGFLSLPSYFGWVVWSLMDFGLWLLLLTSAFWLTVRLLRGEQVWWLGGGLAVATALLSITRPEGIAAAFGFAVLLGVFGPYTGRRVRHTGVIALIVAFTCVVFAMVASLRVAYFGDIFPNTFYSKVSTDRVSTFLNGARYAWAFLQSPFNLSLIALAMLAPAAVGRAGGNWRGLLPLWLAAMVYCACGSLLYIMLGGDHFGSFRFFLFLFPVLFPFAALTLAMTWRDLSPAIPFARVVPFAAAVGSIVITWGIFSVIKGDYLREFRIAEQGRERGKILSTYPGNPSIGIVAAGGIAMTYDAHIYDLMGLNWVEMAHADRDKAARHINHGGFSREVFYAHQPDIVLPLFAECDKQAYDENPFFPKVLDYIFAEPEFQALYTFECWRDLAYYRRTEFPSVLEQ